MFDGPGGSPLHKLPTNTMSPFDPKIHHRRSIRLPDYDYTQAGAYFVTIVTWWRGCPFGEVVNEEMHLNDAGQIVKWEWINLSQRFKFIELGAFMVMPNHFHGILIFHDVGATHPGISREISGKMPSQEMAYDGLMGRPYAIYQPTPCLHLTRKSIAVVPSACQNNVP